MNNLIGFLLMIIIGCVVVVSCQDRIGNVGQVEVGK